MPGFLGILQEFWLQHTLSVVLAITVVWVFVFTVLLRAARVIAYVPIRPRLNVPYTRAGASVDAAALMWVGLGVFALLAWLFGYFGDIHSRDWAVSVVGVSAYMFAEFAVNGMTTRAGTSYTG